ncbi:hypothetical protein HDU82_003366 [Entophlyctis luteolus]|nr:hypothetical protein HDU82_003366 [Entophlyctis luteolus]
MQSAPPSAAPASVHEMEPTLTLQETASAASLPAYDGPVPRGTTLLAAVKIDFGRPEEYFSTVRPVPLEDRLPNLVYATRISALNAALREPEMQRSIRYIGVFKPFALLASVACAAVAVGVYYALRNAFALVFLFVAGWMVFYLGPTNAKYTRKCEEMAAQWTKEDELSGINLQTIVRKTRNHKNSSRIDVTLVFTEKAHFSGDVVEEGESLPVYTENAVTTAHTPPVKEAEELVLVEVEVAEDDELDESGCMELHMPTMEPEVVTLKGMLVSSKVVKVEPSLSRMTAPSDDL